jgi:hypothetical protein
MSQDNQTRTPEAPQASRRALLFGIAAVGAVASPAVASALLKAPKAPVTETSLSAPPAAAPSPDAKLLQLFDEYMATEYWRLSELVERGKAEHTPNILCRRQCWSSQGMPSSVCRRRLKIEDGPRRTSGGPSILGSPSGRWM